MSNIVNVFKSEKELFDYYPKKFYFTLKDDVFGNFWDKFLLFAENRKLNIRPIVIKEVSKMLDCKTSALGYSLFSCPNCNHEHFQYNTCKSKFCNSCGVKYSKQRTLNILSKLISCKHRHLTFTIPSSLWPLFKKDRKLLNTLFEAVNITLSSWFKEQKKYENFKPGFISILHTFGRDDKWNTHIHCLIAEAAMGNFTVYKKIDFFPFDMLRKRFQKVLLDLLELNIGKSNFRKIKNNIYLNSKNGFYVRAKKNDFPNSKKALEYILRYCGRPCFAQYRIIDIEGDKITFWYQRHEDDCFVVECIHIFEFISRIIVHIQEEQFKTIRYYGFYSSKSHKHFNQFKLLIDKAKVPIFKSLLKWRMLFLASFNKDPLTCPICGTLMNLECLVT